MRINQDFVQEKLKLDKEKLPKKNKKNRKTTFLLFFGTILLSLIFWLRPRIIFLWQNLFKPVTYQVIKSTEIGKDLDSFIGFKPSLSSQQTLLMSINLLLEKLQGEYGIYINELKNKNSFGVNENQVFTAASVNKVPIMVSFYQQVEKRKLKEDGEYRLRQSDIQDYGTGLMRYAAVGETYTYSQLIELTGKQSDNTAAYVLESLAGKNNVQELLDKLEMKNTLLTENKTTPREMGDFFARFYNGEILKKENAKKVFDALTNTDFEDRISLGVPEGIKIAHKIGNEIQTYNDCGIVFGSNPYVLCILTSEVVENEALVVIPKISRLVWEFESQ